MYCADCGQFTKLCCVSQGCWQTGPSRARFIRTEQGSFCSRLCARQDGYLDKNLDEPDHGQDRKEFCQNMNHTCNDCGRHPNIHRCGFCYRDETFSQMVLGDLPYSEEFSTMSLCQGGVFACESCVDSEKLSVVREFDLCSCRITEEANREEYIQHWITSRLDVETNLKGRPTTIPDPRLPLCNGQGGKMNRWVLDIVSSFIGMFSRDETSFEGVCFDEEEFEDDSLAILSGPLFDTPGQSSCVVSNQIGDRTVYTRISRKDGRDITLSDVWGFSAKVPVRAKWVELFGHVMVQVDV